VIDRLLCVGDLNADVTITAPTGVVVGSDTEGSVVVSGGGSAANVAAWSADLGVASRFAGVVGDDRLADILVDELIDRGVEVMAVRRPATATRAVAVIVAGDRDRSMVSALDTATILRSDDIDTSWFDGASWLHLTAYTYFPIDGRRAFHDLVRTATQSSIPWSIDPSSARMLAELTELEKVRRAITGAAIAFPNRDEAAWLAGTDDVSDCAQRLLDLAETVVVTCGGDGAVVARRGRATMSIPPVATSVVNTLGCGDAFAAGFISGRLRGLDDAACAMQASEVAARAAATAASR
jgi:sugar/nucleoside kinase (ribokinase family)